MESLHSGLEIGTLERCDPDLVQEERIPGGLDLAESEEFHRELRALIPEMLHSNVERRKMGTFVEPRSLPVGSQGLVVLFLHRPAVTVGDPRHSGVLVPLKGTVEVSLRGVEVLDQEIITADSEPDGRKRGKAKAAATIVWVWDSGGRGEGGRRHTEERGEARDSPGDRFSRVGIHELVSSEEEFVLLPQVHETAEVDREYPVPERIQFDDLSTLLVADWETISLETLNCLRRQDVQAVSESELRREDF